MVEREETEQLTSDQVADHGEVGELWARATDYDALSTQAQRDFALAVEWQATAEGYRVRAEVAESQRENLRANYVALGDDVVMWQKRVKELRILREAAESECAALRAEVERLRRDAEEWKANWQNATKLVESHRRDALTEARHAIASEYRLAAATELLDRWQSFSFCRIGANWNDEALVGQTHAFLAAQTAKENIR